MDTTTCTTIVLVLLWLSLCCQALGFLLILIGAYNSAALHNTHTVIPTTSTLSTVLLGVCLWQCRQAGYLVQPMTWYHWVLLVLLVLLQVVAVLMEYLGQLDPRSAARQSYVATWTYPIYGVVVVLLGILGGTLFCGWKCNLFCRPCCKSQYICYGSAIVVTLVLVVLLAVTASMTKYHQRSDGSYGYSYNTDGQTEIWIIGYFDKMIVPCAQFYSTAVIWNTTVRLPYTVPEVVVLVAAAMAVAALLVLAVPGSTMGQHGTKGYPLLVLHLVALGITLYCLEYKAVFHWPKDYMCFGIVAVVLVVTLVLVAIVSDDYSGDAAMKYTLLGYSLVLMAPTLWYAYRCGLLTWCLPKKKGLKDTDTAENTTADSDIAAE